MPPVIASTIEEARHAIARARQHGQCIGLVPTMGALHAGHSSLMRQARAATDFVAVSIFVNPTQFGPNEDFHRYPRPFAHDVAVCEAEGVDLIFHPEPATLYPADFQTFVEVGDLQKPLCGARRPGHFRGVATVVLKLFQILQPEQAFFGQKDAQQARLLLQMVHDLNVPVKLVICPIVREADGLAMSSRNQYLSPEQRREATILFRTLESLRYRVEAGERDAHALRTLACEMLERAPGAKADYVEIVSWKTLQPLEKLHGEVLVALAVHFGTTRLIDNWLTTLA